jgi:hypothetical protein
MVNPYFIIGAMIAVGGAYGYGHHVGWGDRDAEMQVEIAKKNDEAREKERELAQQLNDQSTKLSEANNVITQKQSSLDSAIRAVGCGSRPQVVYKPPQMPPLPAEIAQKREVNLSDRFMKLLTPNEQPSQPLPKSSPKATETRPN